MAERAVGLRIVAWSAPILLGAALTALSAAPGAAERASWEPVGLSGGGGMFTPAISPADPNLMMLNCDMSAAYISEDGGRNWRMIHHAQLRSDTRCRPAFHPTDAGRHLRLLRRAAQGQPRPRQDLRGHRQPAGLAGRRDRHRSRRSRIHARRHAAAAAAARRATRERPGRQCDGPTGRRDRLPL